MGLQEKIKKLTALYASAHKITPIQTKEANNPLFNFLNTPDASYKKYLSRYTNNHVRPSEFNNFVLCGVLRHEERREMEECCVFCGEVVGDNMEGHLKGHL